VKRHAWRGGAVLAIAAMAASAGTSVTRASAAGKIAPSFSKSGKTYRWTTVGTGWAALAAAIIATLAGLASASRSAVEKVL
jgi:hypothetical protein